MPLIVEAYSGRVEMLNAIFGGGDKAKPKAAQAAKRPAKPAIYAAGADVGAGFRALAALNKGG